MKGIVVPLNKMCTIITGKGIGDIAENDRKYL